MNQLLRSIWAALDALLKRAAERRATATQTMRDALARPVAASAPAPTVRGAARTRGPGIDPALNPSFTSAPRGVPAPTVAKVVPSVPDGLSRTEASIVRGIFSNPQSLAAAFIAAEILAQPLALRDR